jgi:integrase-like protein
MMSPWRSANCDGTNFRSVRALHLRLPKWRSLVVLPAWSPNVNAFAERFVESATSECLDRMVLLGERPLRVAVEECVHHYHEERPYQGLGNECAARPEAVALLLRDVRRHRGRIHSVGNARTWRR